MESYINPCKTGELYSLAQLHYRFQSYETPQQAMSDVSIFVGIVAQHTTPLQFSAIVESYEAATLSVEPQPEPLRFPVGLDEE